MSIDVLKDMSMCVTDYMKRIDERCDEKECLMRSMLIMRPFPLTLPSTFVRSDFEITGMVLIEFRGK